MTFCWSRDGGAGCFTLLTLLKQTQQRRSNIGAPTLTTGRCCGLHITEP
jgi:hypothetical protein